MEAEKSDSVKVYSCTLNELFNGCIHGLKGSLHIPEYQRPYVWGEKQINQLLNDLTEYNTIVGDKPMYYLGSIILHQKDNKLNIIDGQQRLTTLSLLQKLINPNFKSSLEFSNTISIKNIKRNYAYLKEINEKKVFEYRDKELSDIIDIENINVTLIITRTEDLAYTFFETQNTGGVPLSGSNIIKAHHLRAVNGIKTVNYQAKKWETNSSEITEHVIKLLTKIRFWSTINWRYFPFYREHKAIKSALIEEFTVNTNHTAQDISYYYSKVNKENGQSFQVHESPYKKIKQPLYDGNNALDFINEYIELYNILFKESKHHLIDDRFYEFRDTCVIDTIFLRELFQVAIITYVSRFGFLKLYEASLWLHRIIYSLRLSNQRNVRQDSVFKLVREKKVLNHIVDAYTPDEVFLFLKKLSYVFRGDNLDKNNVKTRYINNLNNYYKDVKEAQKYKDNTEAFDIDLFKSIKIKLK